MNLRAAVFLLAIPLAAVEAQTTSVDCSRRTAEDYVAITRTERLAAYIRSLTGAEPLLYSAALAGVDQVHDHPREWGQGTVGYSRRFGTYMAESIIGNTLQHGFALGLGEDNRYFYSGSHNPARRFVYAVSSPLLARHSNRSRSVSISALSGFAAAAMLCQIWQPSSRNNIQYAARSFGLTFAFRAGLDLLREFAPKAVGAVLQ
jgi:hypothetical protein